MKGVMLDFDLSELLHNKLAGDRRPPDGKLHPSGDLIGSLRHAQLRAAGAPTIASEIVSDTRLMTGTLWHTYFEDLFRGKAAMLEIQLDPWLPEGWSGRADWVLWSNEYRAFVLGDLKTTRGEGMSYLARGGMKPEHRWQLSAYWYALRDMGVPLVNGICTYYLPMNVPSDNPQCEPMLLEADPIDEALIRGEMNSRWQKTAAYLESVGPAIPGQLIATRFVTPSLAPVQERVQAIRWNKQTSVWDVKLQPHWSAAYCPYPAVLCDCREQGQTKIGHYTAGDPEPVGAPKWEYVPRKGYEGIKPTVSPK